MKNTFTFFISIYMKIGIGIFKSKIFLHLMSYYIGTLYRSVNWKLAQVFINIGWKYYDVEFAFNL